MMESYQQWCVKAKLKGYPLCSICFEPVPKSDWKAFEKRGKICHACSVGIEITHCRDRIEQTLKHVDRGSVVVSFLIE